MQTTHNHSGLSESNDECVIKKLQELQKALNQAKLRVKILN